MYRYFAISFKCKYVDIWMQYNFISHHQFIQDVTDVYIVSAFLDIMDMDEVSSQPFFPVFLNFMTTEYINFVL